MLDQKQEHNKPCSCDCCNQPIPFLLRNFLITLLYDLVNEDCNSWFEMYPFTFPLLSTTSQFESEQTIFGKNLQ